MRVRQNALLLVDLDSVRSSTANTDTDTDINININATTPGRETDDAALVYLDDEPLSAGLHPVRAPPPGADGFADKAVGGRGDSGGCGGVTAAAAVRGKPFFVVFLHDSFE